MKNLEEVLQELLDNKEENNAEWNFNVGETLNNMYDYESSLQYLQTAKELGLDSGELNLALGISYSFNGMVEEANLLLEKALSQGMDKNICLLYLAGNEHFSHEYEKALSILENVEINEENEMNVLSLKVNCMRKCGFVEECIDIINRVIELGRDDEWINTELMNVYIVLQDFDEALRIVNNMLDRGFVNYSKYYAKAYILVMQEDYEQCFEILESIIEDENFDVHSAKIMIECLISLDEFETCIVYAKNFLEVFKDNDYLMANLAKAYCATNEFSKGIEIFKTLVENYPDDLTYKGELCNAYEASEEYEKALEDWLKIYETSKDDNYVIHKIAYNYFCLENYEEALNYTKLVDKDYLNRSLNIVSLICEINENLGNFEEVIKYATILKDAEPRNYFYLPVIARAYSNLDQFDNVISFVTNNLTDKIDNESKSCLLDELMLAYRVLGKANLLEQTLEEFIKLNPTINTSNKEYYDLLIKSGKTKKAEEFFDNLDIDSKLYILHYQDKFNEIVDVVMSIEDYSSSCEYVETLQRAYNNLGYYEKSIEIANNYLDKYSDNKNSLKFGLAYAYSAKGELELAINILEGLLKNIFDYRVALHLAIAYRRNKDYKKSINLFEKINEKYKNVEKDVEYLDELALCYIDMQDLDKALVLYEKIESIDLFNGEIARNYANLLEKLGKDEKAKKFRGIEKKLVACVFNKVSIKNM